MRVSRVLIGGVISVAVFGLVLPAAYWFISKSLDRLMGLPEEPIGTPISLILTGLSWSLGLFWITWSYSYLVFAGEGSPVEAFGLALEPTRKLVKAGPYAYVRNPMVFGLLLIFLGVAFLANSISGLALVPIAGLVAALYLRLFEEKSLVSRFGREYEEYRKHVPMLIPRPTLYVTPEPQK